MRRVVITGLGAVSCLGNSKEDITESLRLGRSGIVANEEFKEMGLRSQVSGSVNIDTKEHIDRKVLQKMLSQVDKLSEEITLQPVRLADGSPGGFRVTSLKPQGLMAKIKLRRNDVLEAVNRHRIVSVEDVYRVLESAAHQSTLSLRIIRNNQKLEMDYVLR